MKVLQLVNTFGPVGGLEMYLARWSEKLCKMGHTTIVVANNLAAADPTLYDVRHVSGFISAQGSGEPRAEAHVLAIAAEFQPDVVLSHNTANFRLLHALDVLYPTVEWVHVFLCNGGKLFRHGDRVCTHAVGPRCLVDWYMGPCGSSASPRDAWDSYRRASQHLEALKVLTAVVVGSEFMREYLIKEGVPKEKLSVADYTVGIPNEQPVRQPEGADKNILFVGRVVYNKGIQYAIRALLLLDQSFRLTIAGDGYYLEPLKQLAERLGVADRVSFPGFLRGAALEEAYTQATIAVVPSIWPEPAGLVVPEPRGRGLSVVVFDVGGLGEWASRYDAVYLAKHADVQSLAEEITKACTGVPATRIEVSTPVPKPLEQILLEITSRRQQEAAGPSLASLRK